MNEVVSVLLAGENPEAGMFCNEGRGPFSGGKEALKFRLWGSSLDAEAEDPLYDEKGTSPLLGGCLEVV